MTIGVMWFFTWLGSSFLVGFLTAVKFVKHNPTLFGLIDKAMSKTASGISDATESIKDKINK